MPDLDWNKRIWDKTYAWPEQGEEWSIGWGSSQAQFYGSIFPRIARWLPTATILEIAPGYGRWTKFLLPMCDRYWGIDLSSKCIDACQAAFVHQAKASFFLNDGLNLDGVADGIIDFVFSFDSLVHAEEPVLQSYLPQLVSKLSSQGVAFIHHSNLGSASSGPGHPTTHGRASTVSSVMVKTSIEKARGFCLVQEEVDWGGAPGLDCLTTFCRQDASFAKNSKHMVNNEFMAEASIIKSHQYPYWP